MTNAHEPSEQLRAAAHRLTHPMQLCSHGDDSDACQLAHAPAADNHPANLAEAALTEDEAHAEALAICASIPVDGRPADVTALLVEAELKTDVYENLVLVRRARALADSQAAMTTPAYAAVVAERFPASDDSRVRFLAPLRRVWLLVGVLREFFAEHPDTPDITYAQVHVRAASMDEFLRLAAKHGATPYGPNRDQFSLNLSGVTLLVTAPREDRPL